MRITDVDAILRSCPLKEPLKLPFFGGLRTIIKRDAMVVRIETDKGLKGFAPGPAHEGAANEINGPIRQALLGKDPLRVNSSPVMQMALLDLRAQFEGCPISTLLGGAKRDSIKLYGSAGMYMAPEKYAQEAAAIAEMGFPAYKMRPGLGPDEDLKTVQLMREAVGPDVGLMVDAHTWWRMGDRTYLPQTIEQLARAMAPYNLTWLEEPLPPDDHAAYAKLHQKKIVPLATGEHEHDEAGFDDLIARNAADYLQLDLLCQGGFDAANRLFKKIKEYKLRFAFHSWGTTFEVLAAAHLGVCWPENVVEWLEYPCYSNSSRAGMYPFPLADEILIEPLNIRAGRFQMPGGA
ncbi:MAG TPA: mandelate racemase/muconate lactonizing enzyme family protein, partial [Tepidisphaeraceae bacterium]|nr:mandelate racemase/muconate lactonizing enzyme family protein [Tepidisphaeraceae bacterium]